MKALWRRLFGRKDELDDATTAYIEGRASPAEADAIRRELDVSPERGREIEELRQTVALMQSVETAPAPRSFALTPDMVPEQRQSFRLDLSYAPAAAAAVLILAVGALIAGDLTDVLRQSESGGTESMSESLQFTDSERVVQGQIEEAAAEKIVVVETVVVEKQVTRIETVVETVVVEKAVTETLTAETATPAPAMELKVVETVVVEKPVTRTEKVVETVVVEKQVAAVVKVVETVVVEKAVEKQVTRTEKVVETVVVEKPVTVTEKIVETPALTAMRVVQESDEATAKEGAPAGETPVVEAAAAAKSVAAEAKQASPTPAAASATLATSVPTVEPTTQPTATPTAEPTAQPTATLVPTIEPTPQPTATPVPTVEPTTQPTSTPVPTIEPTPRPITSPTLQEDEATRVVAEQDDHRGVKLPLSGISLPLWQLEVLFAVLAGLMVALWAVLRQRSGRRN